MSAEGRWCCLIGPRSSRSSRSSRSRGGSGPGLLRTTAGSESAGATPRALLLLMLLLLPHLPLRLLLLLRLPLRLLRLLRLLPLRLWSKLRLRMLPVLLLRLAPCSRPAARLHRVPLCGSTSCVVLRVCMGRSRAWRHVHGLLLLLLGLCQTASRQPPARRLTPRVLQPGRTCLLWACVPHRHLGGRGSMGKGGCGGRRRRRLCCQPDTRMSINVIVHVVVVLHRYERLGTLGQAPEEAARV